MKPRRTPAGRSAGRGSAHRIFVVSASLLIATPALARHEEERRGDRHEERREDRGEDRQDRQDRRENRRENRQENKQENRQDDRQDRRDDRRNDRREQRHENPRPAAPFTVGPGQGGPVMRGAPPRAMAPMRPRFAPPPALVERPQPRPGFVWAPGYHEWRDDRYVWIGGRYEPERAGFQWSAPRWELQGGVFVSLPGMWIGVNAQPVAPPPPPPPEPVIEVRPGFVWMPGFHEWRGTGYVWVGGRWEAERPNEQWSPGRWEHHGNHWGWHHGGWHRRH